MRTKILAIVAFCLSSSCHAAGEPQLISYKSIDADLYIVLAADRSEAYLGHIAVDTAPCAIGDETLCIEFDGHLFTVADSAVTTPEVAITSERDDFTYPTGITEIAEKISVRTGDFSDTFWYSPTKGLLAIELALASDGRRGSTFVLVGNCGYGANRNCIEQ